MNNKKHSSYIVFAIVLFFSMYSIALTSFLNTSIINNIDDILIILTASLSILTIAFKGKMRRATLAKPIALFTFICIFSGILNNVPFDVLFLQLRSYLIGFVFYLTIMQSDITRNQCINLIKLFIFLLMPLMASAVIEYITKQPILAFDQDIVSLITSRQLYRVYTLSGNPIDFSNLAALGMIFVFSFYGKTFRTPQGLLFNNAWFKLTMVFSIGLSLLLAGTKGAYIGLALAIIIHLTNNKTNIKLSSKLLILGLIIGALVTDNNLTLRLSSFFKNFEYDYRISFLIDGWRMIEQNFFLGVGPGRYGGWVSINYELSPVYQTYQIDTFGLGSVDIFSLHLLGEVGIMGFAAYYWSLFRLSIFLKNSRPYLKDKFSQTLTSFCSVILIFSIIISMFSMSFEIQSFTIPFFLLLGITEKIIRGHQSSINLTATQRNSVN